ncbi:hypothetical protein [Streptomyces paludis]|uniref:Uncharacterized protein n=1 Tax=Streptomyces paludis TaxID=2282738 RepID=A0A345HX64_9ACTN|nr:hypothetical protein [Streptomyces paludis]AXG81288.1 hypothetical protein DVK44_30365 [Streptomyces paludis]
MSEYQYYEFLAIDRPLSAREREQVRALSSRAEITSTSFRNEYHCGDFRGDPTQLTEAFYDAHLYYADWGSRRLLLRLPAASLPAKSVAPYRMEESLSAWTRSGHTLVDLSLSWEDGEEWDFESSFTLASLVGVRAELAAGDLRALYLAWLAGLTEWELQEDDEESYTLTLEPPVPAGLGELTGPQRTLADFLNVDPDLLAVASRASAPGSAVPPTVAPDLGKTEKKALAAYVAALPAAEKNALLVKAALGTGPHPGPHLLARYRATLVAGPPLSGDAPTRRTAAQLLDAAFRHRTERDQREQRARAEAERVRALEITSAREAQLASLAENTDQAWQDVYDMVVEKKPTRYDLAVTLLKDLREVHGRADTGGVFDRRIAELRATYPNRPALLRRFSEAKF